MRKFLSYTLIALLLGGIAFLFWDDLSSFWKKSTIIASFVTGLFICKDFISWVFHFILKKFSSLFKWFIALIASFLLFWGGYNILPEDGSVKKNIDEMKSSIHDFFKIPKQTASISDDEVIIIPSTSESSRNIYTSSLSTDEGERILIYTDSSSNEAERNTSQYNNENKETQTASIDPLDALFSENNRTSPSSDEVIMKEEEEITQEITQNTISSDEVIMKEKEEKTEKTDETITEISFTDDSEQNWKTPVIQILNSPEATTPIIVETNKTINVVAVANEEKSNEEKKDSLQTSSLLNSEINLPSSGTRDEKFKILFREISVQVVYPIEYILSNAIWTDKENTIDTVSFTVTTPEKTTANVTIDITNSGKLYNKYFKSFENKNSTDENLFFIESTSSQSVSYVSFFAGNCWEITISLPEKTSPTLDDFYKILLPAVFEAQE